MAESDESPQDVLRREIIGDAKSEAEKTLLRARQDAEALVAGAEAEAARERERALGQARAAATRRAALVLAMIPVETGRMRSERVEALLQGVHDEALRLLKAQDGASAREVLVGLAAEAARNMDGDQFAMRLSPADRRALGEDWLPEVRRLAGKPAMDIRLGEALDNGDSGPILLDPGGRQVWDNRMASRLARNWPALRIAIAERAGLMAQGATGEGRP